MSLFSKKKEETDCSCGCGCGEAKTDNIAENCCCGEQINGICCIKILGSGCKNCHSLFENTKAAVQEMKLGIEVEYVTDMEKSQYSKLISDIPTPDIAVSMGCDVGCPCIDKEFDDDWGLQDPTGQSDEVFIEVIKQIEFHIKKMTEDFSE